MSRGPGRWQRLLLAALDDSLDEFELVYEEPEESEWTEAKVGRAMALYKKRHPELAQMWNDEPAPDAVVDQAKYEYYLSRRTLGVADLVRSSLRREMTAADLVAAKRAAHVLADSGRCRLVYDKADGSLCIGQAPH